MRSVKAHVCAQAARECDDRSLNRHLLGEFSPGYTWPPIRSKRQVVVASAFLVLLDILRFTPMAAVQGEVYSGFARTGWGGISPQHVPVPPPGAPQPPISSKLSSHRDLGAHSASGPPTLAK